MKTLNKNPFLFTLLQITIVQMTFQAVVGGIWEQPKYKCPEKINSIYPCECDKGGNEGLYIHCENANLASLSVAFQNLGTFDFPIEQLVIRNGRFGHLFGPIFLAVKARILVIEDTPIKVIEDYVFYGINNTLEKLSITGSNLLAISPLSFGILGKLTELTIDGHLVEKLDKDVFVNQLMSDRLEVLRFINGKLYDVPIETFQPLRKLKTLDLHGNEFASLKRNQFKNLRSVEILDLSNNNISKFEAQHISDLTKLGWCNISHNALTELARGTFARNSVLKVLNMSHNNITRLDINSFRGMRFLRRLYLNDNNIYEIGRSTFGSVSRIGTIDLARNKLRKIEFQMFFQLNYVEVINLAENDITLVEKHSFKDIYQAVVNISHNMLEIIEPLAFENCVNITILDLSFNRIKNFSKNSFDATTFANVFQLSHNMLTSLAQIPIENMANIKIINASNNQITDIPKNCFPKLYELHTIDASHNNISIIANGVFQSLFSIRFLNLSYNNMEEIRSSVFGTLPTLLELDLSHNKLISIARGALSKLTSMRTVDLSHNYLEKLFQIPISLNELYLNKNNIQKIPIGTWPVMNSLIYLDLSANQIGDQLETDSFKGLLVLQKLLLNENGITGVPRECLQGMSTLQYLYLKKNNITTLKMNALGKLPVLFEVNLQNNEIKTIEKRAFEGLLQLLTLNLSANFIDFIPNDAFIGLPSLRKLDLAFNSLSKLDNKTNGVLDDLLSLEDLNLSHNKFSFVTKKTFPSHQYIPYNLKYLDLSYNQMPVLTYDITFGTKKLIKLNLSYNHINEIRKGVLGNFSSLEYLDLSHNELSDLMSEEDVFRLPKNLTQIYLQSNKIYRLPFERFANFSKISVMDIRNNSFIDFHEILVSLMRNNTVVLFAGNPLQCSCYVRPLKHFMLEQSVLAEDLKQITCHTPVQISGQYLEDVQDKNLQCLEDRREPLMDDSYMEITDIRFRDIRIVNKGDVWVRWLVVLHKDIAGFILYVRNKQNTIFYQADLPYNVRENRFSYGPFHEKLDADTEICIVSKDSNGQTGRWFSRQCRHFPNVLGKGDGEKTCKINRSVLSTFVILLYLLTYFN